MNRTFFRKAKKLTSSAVRVDGETTGVELELEEADDVDVDVDDSAEGVEDEMEGAGDDVWLVEALEEGCAGVDEGGEREGGRDVGT